MRIDARVHRFIYDCAGNPFLAETLDRYLNLSMRIWHLVLDRLPHLFDRVSEPAACSQRFGMAMRNGRGRSRRITSRLSSARFAPSSELSSATERDDDLALEGEDVVAHELARPHTVVRQQGPQQLALVVHRRPKARHAVEHQVPDAE